MKKMLFTCTAAACCLTMAVPAFAYTPKKIGTVYSTDIIAYIDKTPIRSYNYSNLTYVMAKDLRNYGFDVAWNEDARTVNITLPENRTIKPLSAEEKKMLETPDPVGEKRYDVYQTDITTMLDGKPMSNTGVPAAINVDGKTLVLFSDLGNHFGKTDWNDQHRIAQIHTKNAPVSSEVFSTDFGLKYKETEKWNTSGFDISRCLTAPAEALENDSHDQDMNLIHFTKTDASGTPVMGNYLPLSQMLIDNFGLELSGEDSKQLALETSETEITLANASTSHHYFPASVYETDLSLYAGSKKITTENLPVFLSIDHQLYIHCDALAEALDMTNSLDIYGFGEGTFEKITE